MHDIRFIRQDPEQFDQDLARRGVGPHADLILKIDQTHREKLTELQGLQAERNQLAKQFGVAKRNGTDTAALSDQSEKIKTKMQALEAAANALDEEIKSHLMGLPNMPHQSTPEGLDEAQNVLEKEWGTIPQFDFQPRQHFEIGEALQQMDFKTAAKLSGSRFVVLKGKLAKLERALAQFMLDTHTTDFGYEEVHPPLLVNDAAMYGTGQLPKFRDDQFAAGHNHWLIPTAEVVLTNLVADEMVDFKQLPLRFTSYTPCFRLEAGSAGRDTRGMIRQHQFTKVELVSITAPEQAEDEHERMTRAAETILERLELPYRRMALCAGDMGFSAIKTYDLDVWLPGQDAYREISSCSNCGDFQGRRMNARFKRPDTKKAENVCTLNGSALAVGRTLVAVLENYQNKDGSVRVPDVLQAYMGVDVITVDD